jgi:hypothetical protein
MSEMPTTFQTLSASVQMFNNVHVQCTGFQGITEKTPKNVTFDFIWTYAGLSGLRFCTQQIPKIPDDVDSFIIAGYIIRMVLWQLENESSEEFSSCLNKLPWRFYFLGWFCCCF